jgi:hypothetical protein
MKEITDAFKWLQNILIPDRAFSWKTLILLSLFSWFMSSLATNPVQDIVATCGWLFLILGVSWVTVENPPRIGRASISPWIIGALISIFLLGGLPNVQPQIALICWPPISAFIACIPDFLEMGLKLKWPAIIARPRIIILILSNILVSCWLQFYFVLEHWLEQYPTLLSDPDKFSKSAFVFKLQPQVIIAPRGTLIINDLETRIKQELDKQPWSKAERWLLEAERQDWIDKVAQQLQKVRPAEEDIWWRFTSKASFTTSGYELHLLGTWQGPSSHPGMYYVEKYCQITKVVYTQSNAATDRSEVQVSSVPVVEINCKPISSLRENKINN